MTNSPQISVVIVNYNVKEYLEQALLSLQRALENISHEIYVVDNASVDDSVAHIRQRFPDVQMIECKENLGFGRANNVALELVKGEYVVLINPDTVVQEDTFTKLLTFFESHPDAGAATCKIINPDGSFSVDCRHSIPTPMIALWKVTGLSKIFPKSKIFAKYNLTYLDPDETYPVPAISGSFMMIKKRALDEAGFFDERFFMYCEDIDLCHRINHAGYKIYYVPTSQIIHYKGESTKKNNIDYIVSFNKALYQFFEKYYAQKTLFFFRWIIILGIVARGIFIYLRNFFHEHFPLILDTIIMNSVILIMLIIRMTFKSGFYWHNYLEQYWIVNLISTVIFFSSVYYLEIYPNHRFSIQGIVKANLLTFILLASLTFFLKQFAFSRMVVLLASIASPALMILWRYVLKRYHRGDKSAWGKDIISKPTIIVGNGSGAAGLFQKIQDMKDISYDLVGVVTVGDNEAPFADEQIPVLGRMTHLKELVEIYHIRQIIFSSDMLSYETILKTMSGMGMRRVEYKIAPSNLEVVIGKSTIERLDDYPLLDIEYAIGKPFNRVTKRVFDIILSTIGLLFSTPFLLPAYLLKKNKRKEIRLVDDNGGENVLIQIEPAHTHKLVNLWLKLQAVLRSYISFVGAPIEKGRKAPESTLPPGYQYKPGITGLVQVNRKKIISQDDEEKYHLHYLKNQSLLLDIEILLKAAFRR